MPISDEVREAVASTNFKTLGEQPAFYAGLAMSDAVAHQRSINAIREAGTGAIVNKIINTDPEEAVSNLKMISGNDLAQQMAALIAALSSSQQSVKTAQSTPPETGR